MILILEKFHEIRSTGTSLDSLLLHRTFYYAEHSFFPAIRHCNAFYQGPPGDGVELHEFLDIPSGDTGCFIAQDG